MKPSSAIVLLTHSVIFMQMRSSGPLAPHTNFMDLLAFGRLQIPFVHEIEVEIEDEDKEEKEEGKANSSSTPCVCLWVCVCLISASSSLFSVDSQRKEPSVSSSPSLSSSECKDNILCDLPLQPVPPPLQPPSPRLPMVSFSSSTPLDGTCGASLVTLQQQEEDQEDLKHVFKSSTSEGKHPDGAPLKRGVVFGHTALKERAAYVIGSAQGVPRTDLVKTASDEFGSLQSYVEHTCSAEDVGPSSFSAEEVQKIGVLDIRLLNLDRHLSNLLVVDTETSRQLVPIDHGFSFPSYKDLTDVYFGWTFWKQCKQAWTQSSLRQVAAIDALADAQKLHELGLPSESILASVFSTLLLKHASHSSISLFRLAMFLQSGVMTTGGEAPSQFEAVLKTCLKTCLSPHQDPCAQFNWSQAAASPPHPNWADLVSNFLSAVDKVLPPASAASTSLTSA
jgi:hypothetical protein